MPSCFAQINLSSCSEGKFFVTPSSIIFHLKIARKFMKTCKALLPLLLFFGACHAGDATGRSYFQPRLPWSDHALMLADRKLWVEEKTASRSHFSFESTAMYEASTSDKDFARYFLPGGKNNLIVQGANVAAGGPAPDISATWLQIVGDNVGAPVLVGGPNVVFNNDLDNAQLWFNNYSSVISLKPRFERTSATVQLRCNHKIGCVPWMLAVGLPVAQMRQRMGLSETDVQHQVATRGAVSPLIARSRAGLAAANIGLKELMLPQYSLSALEAFSNPNKRYGKINHSVLSATGLGDLSIDFSLDPCSFLTLGVRGEVPTSQKGTAEYLFEPLVGSNGHGTIAAYATVYKQLFEHNDFIFAARAHGQYQAQLPSNELRTCDLLAAGPWSRYLLLLDVDNDPSNGQSGVNFLTRSVRVSSLQNMTLDISADACYKAFSASIGYGICAREQEKLTLRGALPNNLFIAGQLAPVDGAGFAPQVVYAGQKNVSINQHINIAQNNLGEPGASPILALTNADIDLKSASMPQYLSQKIMATVGYTGRVFKQLVSLHAGGSYEVLHYGNSYNVYSLFTALTLKI